MIRLVSGFIERASLGTTTPSWELHTAHLDALAIAVGITKRNLAVICYFKAV